ncbi:MAG TPA: hypothetical protein VM683_02430 [Anaeromyxobacteraceae bacterium]|jgi:hypothetical protein|nr:hypothetical protein [Anaeromyxobacteraceae bacterium]
MKRLIALTALVLSLAPLAARAQVGVNMNIQLGLPVAPPMVVVQPGVQVVENYDEEVFYTGGWYWVRRDGRWWRAREPRATFVYVEPRRVPPGLVRIPPGQYRHWNKERAKAERREWKEARKAEKHAWKEERREERHEQDHDHGEHGHGHHGD